MQRQRAAQRGNVEDIWQLSPMQSGMAFHSLLDPRSGAYFQQLCWRTRGPLDRDAFEQAWRLVLERHPILRTAVVWEDVESPVQVVLHDVALPVGFHDVAGADCEQRIEAFLAADRARGFALDQPPLLRIQVLRRADDDHQVVWSFHHCVLDGWSLGIVLCEALAAYAAFSHGAEPELAASVSFRVYAEWLRKQDRRTADSFWRELLAPVEEPTNLAPLVHPAAAARPAAFGMVEARVSSARTQQLRRFAGEQGVTLGVLVQGAWALALARQTGDAEVVFGLTVSGRDPEIPGVERIVGNLLNTVPVRVAVDRTSSPRDWLQALQGEQLSRQPFEHVPLVALQGFSRVPRGVPLFDTIVVIENYPMEALQTRFGDTEIAEVRYLEQTHYPLTLTAYPEASLRLRLEFDAGRVARDSAARLLASVDRLLDGLTESPTLRDCARVEPAEAQRLEDWGRGPERALPSGGIHALVERWIETRPEEPAVAFGAERWSYRDLGLRAAGIRAALRAVADRPPFVALLLSPGLDLVASVLAVLQSGAAYVPIDPELPERRIRRMLARLGPCPVLTCAPLRRRLEGCAGPVVELDRVGRAEAAVPGEAVDAGAPAYVMHTSGSTGEPKAVLVTHAGLVNAYCGWREGYDLECRAERHLQAAPVGFDVWTGNWARALASGGTLVLCRKDQLIDGAALAALLRSESIACVELVPGLVRLLAEHLEASGETLEALRLLAIGSERWTGAELRRFRRLLGPRTRIVNSYGVTEAAVDSTWFECHPGVELDADEAVPIGRPFPNVRVEVRDRGGDLVPTGAVGELWIGGPGVASGYLCDAQGTAQRFRTRPDGSRCYRTGDRARWLESGQLQLLGRDDDQVKIRGRRIELGEVEAALRGAPGVGDACASLRKLGDGSEELVAYAVVDRARLDAVRVHCAEALPAYAVPRYWVALEALPRTASGKLDRARLPEPERPERVRTEPVLEPLERRVAEAFAHALDLDPLSLSRDDDYFALGGHSLLVPRVFTRLQRALGLSLPMRLIFDASSVAGLAAGIRAAAAGVPADAGLARLEADARLPDDVDARMRPARIGAGGERSALLTGATGFVGAHLLRALLDETPLDVICLVRADSVEHGRQRLRRSFDGFQLGTDGLETRVRILPGDLAAPALGVADAEQARLQVSVDRIYHCGASTNLVRSYEQLHAGNVGGTLELLRLAVRGGASLHFVSTLAVPAPAQADAAGTLRELLPPVRPDHLVDGYSRTKWVSEQHVASAWDRGVRAAIYRLGTVTADSTRGVPRPEPELVWTLLAWCLGRRVAPQLELALDLVPVDACVRAIVALSQDPPTPGAIHHLSSSAMVPLRDVFQLMRARGHPLRDVPVEELPDLLAQVASEAADASAAALVPLLEQVLTGSQLELEARVRRIDARATRARLAERGIGMPDDSRTVLERLLTQLELHGVLPRRGDGGTG